MENITNERIYSLLDWLTVMVYDTSVSSVYEWLHLDYSNFLEDLLEDDRSFITEKNGYKICINYNGIRLELFIRDVNDVALFNAWKSRDIDSSGILSEVFPSIRVDISGSGLQYLRNNGLNVDVLFRKPENILGYPNVNITRCDFSFDFINYNIDIVQQYINFYYENKTETQAIQCFSSPRPFKVKIVDGSQRIMYIGSTKQMLRLYDKRLQYYDLKTDTPKVSSDKLLYGDVSSWYRIELQLRKEYCAPILFGKFDLKDHDIHDNEDVYYFDPEHDNMLPVLKYIYEKFDFVEKNGKERSSALFLRKLFNWNNIPRIIKFAFSEIEGIFVPSPTDRAINSISRSTRKILCYIQKFGVRSFWMLLQDYLNSCYDDSLIDSITRRRALLNDLNEFDIPSIIYTCDNSPLQKIDGRLYLQDIDKLL